MDQLHIIGVSRFIKEIPEDLFSEESELGDDSDYKFNDDDDVFWGYGGVKRDRSIPIFKTGKEPSFAFRSAESFLSNFNKTKEENNIDISKYKEGVRVYHKKFGEGTINYIEEEGEDYKVDINFDKAGHKRLMAKFAGLEIIE